MVNYACRFNESETEKYFEWIIMATEKWLAVNIYRAAKRQDKYPTLATDTEVNSFFSIY